MAGGPVLCPVLWAHSGLAGTGVERPQLMHDTAEGNRGSQSRARRPPAPFTPLPRPVRSCSSVVCASADGVGRLAGRQGAGVGREAP